jgi:uncharacterized protein (DUF1015 family)
MATILPFTAVRYDTSKVKLANVLTQPYDKITPEMQERYYSASRFNLVHMELGKAQAGDNDKQNVYTRAAEFLELAKKEGALVQDREPSIYAYSQTFSVPSTSGAEEGGSGKLERRGFIALGRLAEYNEGVVYRHEQTLSKPKSDRLNLLRATKTHSGQIFMLYSEPEREIDNMLATQMAAMQPSAEVTDEYGVLHRTWKVSDTAAILTLRDRMSDKKLIIADGHHRYETALAYRMERRAEEIARLMAAGRTGQLMVNSQAGYENTMMTFVNMDSEGLVILPTHRVVFGLEKFKPKEFLKSAAKFFEVEELKTKTIALAIKALAAARHETALVAVMKGAQYLLKAKPESAESRALFEGLSERQRRLDVVQLHKVLLQHVLKISEEDIREQKHLNYVRSAEEAARRVSEDAGANVAFLMNPVRMEQLREIAFAGEVMPQKSTDFYPKLLSGLCLYALE